MKVDSTSICVITGGADGIGKQVTKELLKLGCTVVIADNHEEKLHKTKLELQQLFGEHHVLSFQINVADRKQMKSLKDFVVENCDGRCSLLFACAGVFGGNPLHECEYEDFDRVMNINFNGTVNLVKEFLPLLNQEQSPAHIVTVSSLDGLIGMPGAVAYCSSKFAVTGFTRALQLDLAILSPHITVSCVFPGFVSTCIIENNKGFFNPDGLIKNPSNRGHVSLQTISNGFKFMGSTTPESAAKQILNGILNDQTRIVVGNDAVILDLFARIAPSIFYNSYIYPVVLFLTLFFVRFVGKKMLLMMVGWWMYKRWMKLEKGIFGSETTSATTTTTSSIGQSKRR
jgi:NAD(P)-dependent dehydrogenase (short-subunit alcohol dehydrogenase family)